jgi:hypothetical protein
MADRYWVGGAGTWDATTTTNWAATSGGASGASAPTSVDNVIFDSLSNATLYTVTVGTNAVCNDLTAAGPLVGNVTFSLGATARLDPYGSMTLPATGLVWTGVSGCLVTFRATTTGKTITTNGVNLTATNITFNGVGGGWTLGSAIIYGTSQNIVVINGTFNTGNFSITGSVFGINVVGTQVVNLGSSIVSLSGNFTISQTAGLSFNAGTSQINCSNVNTTFAGGGQTFYNVSFTGAAAGISTITGINTFNNLTQISRSVTGIRTVSLGANQTVNGTLTLGAANTSIRRIQVQSDIIGTFRTITLNGTLAALSDVDFRDIDAAGSFGTWTGTRIGNGGNNYNIGVAADKDVYWNLAAGGDWSATGWALSSGGAVDANNFPLAQDRVIIENTGLNTSATITINAGWWIGELDLSTRSNAMTFNGGANAPPIYRNVTLSSAVTMAGTGAWTFSGQGITQILDVNTATFVPPITINSVNGTLQLAENTTCSATVTLTSGTLSLNNFNLTCNVFNYGSTFARTIAFGTGVINVTGTNVGVISAGLTGVGLSYTGTPRFNLTGVGVGGQTRTLTFAQAVVAEANAVDVYVTAGTDIVTVGGTGFNLRTLDFTGFSGTFTRATNSTQFGNLVISSGMTLTAGAGPLVLAATSGTQLITTNGQTLDFAVSQTGVGGTVQLQDNLTMGATRTYTLTNGTLDLSNGNRTLTTGLFSSNNSNTRAIAFGTGKIHVTGNNAIVVVMSSLTNFSYTGTSRIELSYSGSTGTRTIAPGTTTGGSTESTALNYYVTAGTDIVNTTGNTGINQYRTLDFTGFAGTITSAHTTNIFRDLVLSSGMTLSTLGAFGFVGTSGTQLITTNGKTLDFAITQAGVGGTVQLQDNLTMGSTRTYTLTNGTLNVNGKVLTVGLFSSVNTNTRTLNLGVNGTLAVIGGNWTAPTATGLTLSGTGAISMNLATAKTFAGGGLVYPYTLNQGGAGTLSITGANTFANMTNTVQPCTITFPASTTTTVSDFNVNGTAGNLVTLNSSIPGTRFTLVRA